MILNIPRLKPLVSGSGKGDGKILDCDESGVDGKLDV